MTGQVIEGAVAAAQTLTLLVKLVSQIVEGAVVAAQTLSQFVKLFNFDYCIPTAHGQFSFTGCRATIVAANGLTLLVKLSDSEALTLLVEEVISHPISKDGLLCFLTETHV